MQQIRDPKAEHFQAITTGMADLFRRKNGDYGNSFTNLYQEYGMLSSIIRLEDKLSRIKSLQKNDCQVNDESVRDSLIDMANYAIMTVMEMDKQAEQVVNIDTHEAMLAAQASLTKQRR